MNTAEIPAHIRHLSPQARQDWAAGACDEVMTDALYAACGAKTSGEMTEARRFCGYYIDRNAKFEAEIRAFAGEARALSRGIFDRAISLADCFSDGSICISEAIAELEELRAQLAEASNIYIAGRTG